MSTYTGKAALVTGSATGAGRAIAVRFATLGMAVAINYSRSEKEAEETLDAVKASGVPGLLCKANVGDDRAVRAMVGRCRDEFGGLDVLVNNAGVASWAHFADSTEEVLRTIMEVNFFAPAELIRLAVPLLVQGEQPAIVDRDLFEAVQAKLNEQVTNHKVSRTKSEALLLGRIFDDRSHRMTPSHARRRGIKYRYYIS